MWLTEEGVLLSEDEVTQLYGVSWDTLRVMRHFGLGPPCMPDHRGQERYDAEGALMWYRKEVEQGRITDGN